MIAVMFSGQGTQAAGMGKSLFAAFPQLVRRADEILGYSIERLCLENPDNRLSLTQYTQVALYVVNALGYMERRLCGDPGVQAEFLLGHSLGEYNALLAAGVFDFETGLRLVVERGNLMAAAQGGSMVVVLGVGTGQIRSVLAQHGLDGIDLAGYNTPTQTVISGPTPEIERAVEILSAARILTAPLNVSAAFHSRQMRGAQLRFAQFASAFELTEPGIPVVANATGRPYEPGHILQTLIAQMAAPVLWTDSVRYLLRQGRVEFTEIGTSVLTKMAQEIARAPV